MTISFNTKEAASAVQRKETNFLDAGIHENIKLTETRIDRSANGTDFLELTFTNQEGRSLRHTIFEPTEFPGMDEDAFKRQVYHRLNLITDILNCYYPKDSQITETSSFLEYIKWAEALLNAANKEKLLRVKIIYRKNGYTALPEGSFYPFIEPMTANPVTVIQMPNDVFVRPIQANKEDNSNVIDGTERFVSKKSTGTDAFPF